MHKNLGAACAGLMTASQKLLAVTAAGLLMSAGAASAATITGYYSVSDAMTHGNAPTITDDLGTFTSGHQYISTALQALTPNVPSGEVNFITTSPAGSCGSGCINYTASGTLTITFNVTDAAGHSATATQTGTYEAKYSGTYLGCSGKSGMGQSDCVDWTGSNGTSTGKVTDVLNFGDGTILDITLYNAEDWAITPKISFDLDPTPLPATLPLFMSGLGALGLLGWRKKREAFAIAA
jgi:hypothetical protein